MAILCLFIALCDKHHARLSKRLGFTIVGSVIMQYLMFKIYFCSDNIIPIFHILTFILLFLCDIMHFGAFNDKNHARLSKRLGFAIVGSVFMQNLVIKIRFSEELLI